ncbi:B12-binding domain-containing radical SAM protein [Bradyrhizobium elkanii]|uniref:B12-binding domain-containing radical SAM protein n=1 Tax=Bradyrhizobium elkanii TaxID=29448 RepID=UPI00209F6760|nr:radical SAM protein [Bradyrhizobium elkanii]MCP1926382.1 putative radical SAM superfamily protein [Bradyrhizobium elkanii]
MRLDGPAMKSVIVQLPFPSQVNPDPILDRYYHSYTEYFASIVPDFRLRAGDLWEAPLWVAHLDAAIGEEDTEFQDLSLMQSDGEGLSEHLARSAKEPALFLFSPLAQNLDLATDVSMRLMRRGHRTAMGGNMVGVEPRGSFSMVYAGHAQHGLLKKLSSGNLTSDVRLGRQPADFGYRPNYRHLARFANRVPLVRINASHGCLYDCSFCGDAWSRQLHLVPLQSLVDEFDDIGRHFPNVRLAYIGDKTFGQSKEAVKNLIAAKPDGYRFVVQTHVQAMSEWLIDRMEELGVVVVEMGFETADSEVLRSVRKRNDPERYHTWIERLSVRGIHVVLNLLGGLPHSTMAAHRQTISFLEDTARHVKLYNLYNFVPYPKTPIFPSLRPRIVDWNFANWREDRPVVFLPFHQTGGELWTLFIELVKHCDRLVTCRIESER